MIIGITSLDISFIFTVYMKSTGKDMRMIVICRSNTHYTFFYILLGTAAARYRVRYCFRLVVNLNANGTAKRRSISIALWDRAF